MDTVQCYSLTLYKGIVHSREVIVYRDCHSSDGIALRITFASIVKDT